MNAFQQARQSGVRIPENQSTAQGPTMKVTNFVPGTWALAEYGNEKGQLEFTLVFICGGRAYVPQYPNYQQWTATFRPLSKDLSDQIIARADVVASQKDAAPAVPSKDAVDIMSSSGA